MPTLRRRALGLSLVVFGAAVVSLSLSLVAARANDQRMGALVVSEALDEAALAVSELVATRSLGHADAALAALGRARAAAHRLPADEAQAVRASLASYRTDARRLRAALVARGVDEEGGAEGRFRRRVHDVEGRVAGLSADVLVPVLQARRREKDYLLRGDPRYVSDVRAHVADAQRAARAALPAPQADTVAALLGAYETGFLDLVALQGQVTDATGRIQRAAGAAQAVAGRVRAASAGRARRFGVAALLAALGSALAVGVAVLAQAREVTRPVARLRHGAARVAQGETAVRVAVEGPEELQTLALALNGVADYADRTAAAERRLAEAQAFLETVIGRAEEGVVVLDPDYRVAYANDYAQRLFGVDMDRAHGRHPGDLVADPAASRRVDFERALAGEVVRTADYRIEIAGRTRWLSATYAPLGTDAEHHGVVVTVHDVSDRVATEHELRTARDTAQAAVQLKSAFLANMSHEIRTPLTGILGYADLLAEEAPPEVADLAAVIHRAGHRLLDTLNSVLDLAQLESGTMEVRCVPVDLSALVTQTAELYASRAHASGLDLRLDAQPGVVAASDARALGRVLDNVVSNALKFTSEGHVTLSLAAEAGEAVVTVADTGIGMEPAFMARMFEEFQQASTGHGRTHEGNGLGLAIVRRLVDLVGGGLDVESAPGEGTRFALRFPLVAAEDEPCPRPLGRRVAETA